MTFQGLIDETESLFKIKPLVSRPARTSANRAVFAHIKNINRKTLFGTRTTKGGGGEGGLAVVVCSELAAEPITKCKVAIQITYVSYGGL